MLTITVLIENQAHHLLRERLGPHVRWAGAGDRFELPALVSERKANP